MLKFAPLALKQKIQLGLMGTVLLVQCKVIDEDKLRGLQYNHMFLRGTRGCATNFMSNHPAVVEIFWCRKQRWTI